MEIIKNNFSYLGGEYDCKLGVIFDIVGGFVNRRL